MNTVPVHFHDWEVLHQVDQSGLRRCRTCPKIQSLMYDYQTKKHAWIDGCYFPIEYPVYIAAASKEQYHEVAEAAKQAGYETHFLHPPFPADEDGINLFLIGNWWDNDFYLNDDFTNLLNRRARP